MRQSLATAILLLMTTAPAFAQDLDGDGLDDADEMVAGSNPAEVDSDADGISDGREFHFYGTDPAARDTDGGGEWDLAEIFLHGTDPTDGTDDTSAPAGNGTFQYWVDVSFKVDNEAAAEDAIEAVAYNRIRSFLWSDVIDFAGPGETGDFTVDTPYFDVLGGDYEDYAGAATAWLYVEPGGGSNSKSVAVGAADGWILDIWDGTQTRNRNHDGGGFKAEALQVDFGSGGGLFPVDLVTWEDKDDESFELSWFDGDEDYDDASFSLIPHTVMLSSDLRVRQYALDVDGGAVEQGDTVEFTVEIENKGSAAAYSLDFNPVLSSNVTFTGYTSLPEATMVMGQVATIPFVDAQTTVTVVYEITVDDVGAATAQVDLRGDAFPSPYPVGRDRIRVLSDDPLLDGATDTGNHPAGLFSDGLEDDDPNVVSVGKTIDVDQCAEGTDNCDPNATCTKLVGTYDCTCQDGFEGDGFTCTDVDECATGTDDCGDNATCTNTPGAFECACDDGYVGDGYDCADVDECSDGTANCDVNATCTNSPGAYTCVCDAGYGGDGQTCTDVDECADGTHDCDANATCTNTPGAFECACDDGYVGDGYDCADVDECSDGTANCDVNATCTNSPGAYACVCDAGYGGDGQTCTDVDECADGTHDCDANATCTNVAGTFECACVAGFTGDGRTCTDVDECAEGTHDCDENATCSNTPGSYECSCDDGFSGDGRTCEQQDCACVDDQVCLGGECFESCEEDVDCSEPGHRCYEERCALDACAGVRCGPGEVCAGGSCFVQCDGDVDCSDPDHACYDGRCTDDPCEGITCGTTQVCWGGSCFEECSGEVDCTNPDDRCYDGRCTDEPCRGVACTETQVCWGGSCFESCAEDLECTNPDESCYDELRCAEAPCAGVQCPTTQICVAGYCRTTCESDEECFGSEICDRGICTTPTDVVPEEGCACSSAGSGFGQAWLALVVLVLLRRRHRTESDGRGFTYDEAPSKRF